MGPYRRPCSRNVPWTFEEINAGTLVVCLLYYCTSGTFIMCSPQNRWKWCYSEMKNFIQIRDKTTGAATPKPFDYYDHVYPLAKSDPSVFPTMTIDSLKGIVVPPP